TPLFGPLTRPCGGFDPLIGRIGRRKPYSKTATFAPAATVAWAFEREKGARAVLKFAALLRIRQSGKISCRQCGLLLCQQHENSRYSQPEGRGRKNHPRLASCRGRRGGRAFRRYHRP